MTALGLLLYIAFFVHVERYSENLAFLVVLLIPLVPAFYLGIGFILYRTLPLDLGPPNRRNRLHRCHPRSTGEGGASTRQRPSSRRRERPEHRAESVAVKYGGVA